MINSVIVEKRDLESGYILKRVNSRNGLFWGRKMPVTNSLFNAEKTRKMHNLPLLDSPFQIHHLHQHKRNYWIYDSMNEAQCHAKENRRIFIPHQQRTQKKMAELDWFISESDFVELLNRGAEFIPFYIPESAGPEETTEKLSWAATQLKGVQQIIPTLSANHQIILFKQILATIFGKYNLIGINFASPQTNANAATNLIDLWEVNQWITEKQNTSLIVGFNNQKHYNRSKVSGSFVCSRYGVDIPSQRQMHPDCVKGMMKTKLEIQEPDPEYIYDDVEGGFNRAEEQIAWYEENKTLKLLSEISLAERLEPYQALSWASFVGQNWDFDKINEAILNRGVSELIQEKSRWAVYHDAASTFVH